MRLFVSARGPVGEAEARGIIAAAPRERPLFSISVFCRSVGSRPLFDCGCTGI